MIDWVLLGVGVSLLTMCYWKVVHDRRLDSLEVLLMGHIHEEKMEKLRGVKDG